MSCRLQLLSFIAEQWKLLYSPSGNEHISNKDVDNFSVFTVHKRL